MKKILACIIGIFLFISLSNAQQIGGGGEANPNLKTNLESLKNWQDKKFGMFIHWGPVSLRGTELSWSRGRNIPIVEYDNLYKEFNPVLFDAGEWVRAAKDAGMKYLVITSKHHDGFSLWDSKYSEYDIMSTPYKKDILKELSRECNRQGIMFCTYHSIADWHHPHYTTRYGGDPRPVEDSDMDKYIIFMKNQLRELVKDYDTKILWFDGEWEDAWSHEEGMKLYKYVRDLNDEVLINNRVDKGRRGMEGKTVSNKFAGDFDTPEQRVGAFDIDNPWESCITIGTQWAWKPNDRLKSLRECIHTLVRTVGGGGNLLLNVGPMLDGRIEERQITRLKEIGDWVEKYGESIYETKGGPFKPNDWMVSTRKENKIFVHLLYWPHKELILPGIKDFNLLSADILGGENLKFSEKHDQIVISLPEKPVDENNTVIVLELNRDSENIVPLDVPPNILKDILYSNIKLKSEPSQKYFAGGVRSLADKLRGSSSYTDGRWTGYEEMDFEALIDLGNTREVKSVKLGCLQDHNVWIFLPEEVSIIVYDENKEILSSRDIKYDSEKRDAAVKIKDFEAVFENIAGKFVKITAKNIKICPDWHKGAGGKAWLFVDEIIIE
ncbi:alpha-L-fucosidase [candidate division KSB1 bacterium]